MDRRTNGHTVCEWVDVQMLEKKGNLLQILLGIFFPCQWVSHTESHRQTLIWRAINSEEVILSLVSVTVILS